MKVKCPSCSTEHESSDYPDAFEIPCSCGYLILKPDDSAGPEEIPFSAAPTSLDAQDEAIKISLSDEVDPAESLEEEKKSLVLNLTPPQELPPEMPYDPAELQVTPTQQDSIPMNESNDFPLAQDLSEPTPDAPVQDSAEHSPLEASASILPEPTEAVQSAQIDSFESVSLIDQPRFKLRIQDADSSLALDLKRKIEWLSLGRPWLKSWVDQVNLLIQPQDSITFESLPEIIAVEFYICALEHGKTCAFENSA